MKKEEILAHTLQFGAYVDGLLGMDFLSAFKIEIRPYAGENVKIIESQL